MSVGAAEALEVLWVQDEQETLLGSVWSSGSAPALLHLALCPPCPGCVLGAKGPDLCWGTRLYSVVPGRPMPVAAHAGTE